MNENELETQEEHLTPAPSLKGREEEPTVLKSTEGETKVERPARLSFVPNRHDRRKAAAIARKEARMEGKK